MLALRGYSGMLTIPVLISIRSNAHREEAVEDETMTMLTAGTLELTETEAVIRYEEQIDESVPMQQVTVTVGENGATMTREGAYTTHMVFRMGCRYEGQYRTPYGDMDLAVYCTRLAYDLGDDGGGLEISYQLDLNGSFAAMHDMELRVMVQGGNDESEE